MELRAHSARDCLGWLRAIARAKDRALAAVARLDDRAHGHDVVLATARDAPGDPEVILARSRDYGWAAAPLEVAAAPKGALRVELNYGAVRRTERKRRARLCFRPPKKKRSVAPESIPNAAKMISRRVVVRGDSGFVAGASSARGRSAGGDAAATPRG